MKQAVTYFLVAASGGSSYVTSEQGRGRERETELSKNPLQFACCAQPAGSMCNASNRKTGPCRRNVGYESEKRREETRRRKFRTKKLPYEARMTRDMKESGKKRKREKESSAGRLSRLYRINRRTTCARTYGFDGE